MLEHDLISKRALLEEIEKCLAFSCSTETLLEVIEEAPAVEFAPPKEEVTACKNCVSWKPDGGYGLDLDGTKRQYGICSITNLPHKENHFCGYAARRTDGES